MKRYVIELQSELAPEELAALPDYFARAAKERLPIPDWVLEMPDDNPNKAMMIELSQMPVMTDEEYAAYQERTRFMNVWRVDEDEES